MLNALWNQKFHYHFQDGLPFVLIHSQMDPVHTISSSFVRIHFHVLPSIPLSPQQYSSYRFPHQNPVYTSLLLPDMPHFLTFSTPFIWSFYWLWWGIWDIKLSFMQFYTVFCHLLFLSSTYFHSTPFLNTLSLCSSLCARNQVYNSVYFNPHIHRQHIADKRFWTRW